MLFQNVRQTHSRNEWLEVLVLVREEVGGLLAGYAPLPYWVLYLVGSWRLGERERGKSCLRWFLCIGTTF